MKGLTFVFCIFSILLLSGMVMGHETSTDSAQKLETTEWPDELVPPTVQLDVQPDTANGWAINVTSTNLPAGAHVHLFVDERLVTELYEDNYTLSSLTPGNHYIGAVVSSPDHHLYTINEKTIHSGTVVMQPGFTLPIDGGTQTTADKSVISFEEAAPYLLGFFALLGLFGFAMGYFLSPGALTS